MLLHPALPEASYCHATVRLLQHRVVVPSHANIHHFICTNGGQAHHIIITPMGTHHELKAVCEEFIHASSMLQFNLFGQRNYECHTMIHLFGRCNCECRAAIDSFGRCNYECRAMIHLFGRRNCECCVVINSFGRHNYECRATIHLFGRRKYEWDHSQCHHYFTCPTWRLGEFHEQKVHHKKKKIKLPCSKRKAVL